MEDQKVQEENQKYHEMRKQLVEKMKTDKTRDPYPHKFETTIEVGDFIKKYSHLKNTEEDKDVVSVAGRIVFKRESGTNLIFYIIVGQNAKIQVFCNFANYKDKENWKIHEILRRGDIIGVRGHPARSKTAELSINPLSIVLLSPCLRMLPFPGKLTELESRYRNRYLDLIVNDDIIPVFTTRTKIIQFMRRFFNERGFLQVETPTMSFIPGGATAKPFVTYHNDLGVHLFMRVAPELYLKELIIGGIEKVYEIGKCYRNEGIDLTHNPEFTSCEAYWAYADYEDIMVMTEQLMSSMVHHLKGSYKLTYHPDVNNPEKTIEIDFTPPFPRYPMIETLEKELKVKFPCPIDKTDVNFTWRYPAQSCQLVGTFSDWKGIPMQKNKNGVWTTSMKLESGHYQYKFIVDNTNWYYDIQGPTVTDAAGNYNNVISVDTTLFYRNLIKRYRLECKPPITVARLIDKLVGHFIEPKLQNPAFIIDQPQIMSPLAKWHRSKPGLSERFELFVAGRELCNAYTELNDPAVQLAMFQGQTKDRDAGDDEAQPVDLGFCEAMEYGLPPTGGWGMGIDRLTMLLADRNNIKEVILFPAMRPTEREKEAIRQQFKKKENK